MSNPRVTKVCLGCGLARPHATRRRSGGKLSPRERCVSCWPQHNARNRRTYRRRHQATDSFQARERARYAAQAAHPITSASSCLRCAKRQPEVRLERHHYRGYEYPLDVQILCTRCHAIADKELEA